MEYRLASLLIAWHASAFKRDAIPTISSGRAGNYGCPESGTRFTADCLLNVLVNSLGSVKQSDLSSLQVFGVGGLRAMAIRPSATWALGRLFERRGVEQSRGIRMPCRIEKLIALPDLTMRPRYNDRNALGDMLLRRAYEVTALNSAKSHCCGWRS
ncbi:hypothetical protein [Phyllobacterium sp. CCNWLW11]|uniref:hypothetical protein n=1 Tax=Phyllobacterium sp. CCNWLW11 TaxID=3126384 RepID=UPI003012D344